MVQKAVIIVGAGSTVADVVTRSKKRRPPLDKEFFLIANSTDYRRVRKIVTYIKEIYGMDILYPENDSLEKIMAMIYTDIFDPNLKDRASGVFQELISLFNKRLADTTNNLPATQQRYLYRVIAYYFNKGFNPKDLTIITFNQDLQIEKVLHKLEQTKRWSRDDKIFNFPFCYMLEVKAEHITSPTRSKENLFNEGGPTLGGVKILKLHGSLNWYSTHRSHKPSPRAMFKSDRVIYITRRQTIAPDMKLSGRHRTLHTLPVIVPPVTHKSSILHQSIRSIWNIAEDELKKADEVAIFGYSCPPLDFESSNLIQRSLRTNTKCKSILIIDPDPNVLTRYIGLIKPREIRYYPWANDFLQKR